MAKTVRDIMVNINSGDLLFSAGDIDSRQFFDVVWGSLFNNDSQETLYANVIIPQKKVHTLKKDEYERCLLNVRIPYYPYDDPFLIRLVLLDNNGAYQKVSSSFPFPAVSSAKLHASELPSINIDGLLLINLVQEENGNTAYIYDAASTDFLIGASDLQSSQLLSICEAGKYYCYPTIGIGATGYIGSVVSNTDLGDKIIEQFKNNEQSVQDAEFNANTGELQIIFFNEEVYEDTGLLSVDDLDLSGIDITDEMLDAVAVELDGEDCGSYYDELLPEIEVPEIVNSCFANGIWMGSMPWTGRKKWKGQKDEA